MRPTELLVAGGYPGHDAIDQATAAGVTLYAPVPKPRSKASEPPDPPIDPHLPKPGDSDAVAAWRARMGTDEAKQIYKQRAATAETVNADAKAHRGIAATALRGLAKVTGNACRFALTYKHLALHHRERVASLTLTVERSSSGWCADSRPAQAYTTSSRRSRATKLGPTLSQPLAVAALITAPVTAGLRSRAARRTVPKR